MHLETELMGTVRERAEDETINVFARNLHDLLMATPAGLRATMEPRSGSAYWGKSGGGRCHWQTGSDRYHLPAHRTSRKSSDDCCCTVWLYNVELVAIGNGTASRETERFYLDVQKQFPKVTAQKVIVSEALARRFTRLPSWQRRSFRISTFRCVARCLSPAVCRIRLAELVKIDPKSIGVGQYQHDVSQTQLPGKLDAVVEDCVNAVGVDLNTASVPLLTRVAGLTRMMAQNIVAWRDENGQFQNRQQLLKVSRLGPKAFEQCAGFLRINHGDNPLDASTVHPEAYPVVERILAATQQGLKIDEWQQQNCVA